MNLPQIIEFFKTIDTFSILYAEDDESVRTSMLNILERLSNDITTVTNGMEAWETYVTRAFSVVITDIHMPRMNGLELIENIYTLNEKQIIIVISAYNEEADMNHLKSDTTYFLSKPLALNQFLDVLQKVTLDEEVQE